MEIPSVAAVVGPTATGKSEVGIEIAGALNGEVVSVDSMQVYKGMDIGTAKVPEHSRYTSTGRYIPHHMLDIVDPTQNYSVAEFQEQARAVIDGLLTRGKLPVLVGGTGLYYHATVREYHFAGDSCSPELRRELLQRVKKEGNESLHRELYLVDPAAAEKIHVNDTKRIIRALEVFYSTGEPISKYSEKTAQIKYNAIAVGLLMQRQALYQRIEERVESMFSAGLVEEVRSLIQKGCSPDASSMQALGYKEVIGYLKGDYDLEACKSLLKKNTRRFAKRQLTWFRRDNNITWFDVGEFSDVRNLVEAIVCHIKDRLQI